jgi:beta-lactam-binding protein with PASTA domain
VRDQSTSSPDDDGIVLDQAPDPEEERAPGSTVRIAVGRLNATPTPTPTPTPAP